MIPETDFPTVESLVKHLTDVKKEMSPTSKVLYRGQADASWHLTSSLERQTKKSDNSVEAYEQQLLKILPEVAALSGNDFKNELAENSGSSIQNSAHTYRPKNPTLMVYARQHGYPTPILDWTESLYIALFFALQSSFEPAQKKLAIYTYAVDEAEVDDSAGEFRLLPLNGVIAHKRHFMQQARYAYAVRKIKNSWFYTSLETTNEMFFGDVEKFTIPSSQREEGLDMLASMNITPFTLYGTEESLLESLAWKYRNGFSDSMTVQSLAVAFANSSSYAETHRIVAQFELSKVIDDVDSNLANYLLNSARRNSQISDILGDRDVTDFILKVAEPLRATLTDKNQMLFQRLQEEKDVEIDE